MAIGIGLMAISRFLRQDKNFRYRSHLTGQVSLLSRGL